MLVSCVFDDPTVPPNPNSRRRPTTDASTFLPTVAAATLPSWPERKVVELAFLLENDDSDSLVPEALLSSMSPFQPIRYYVVSTSWLVDFLSFATSQDDLTPPPSPINNSSLLLLDSAKHRLVPRPGLKLDGPAGRTGNFRLLNRRVYDFLYSRYGGGPTIVAELRAPPPLRDVEAMMSSEFDEDEHHVKHGAVLRHVTLEDSSSWIVLEEYDPMLFDLDGPADPNKTRRLMPLPPVREAASLLEQTNALLAGGGGGAISSPVLDKYVKAAGVSKLMLSEGRAKLSKLESEYVALMAQKAGRQKSVLHKIQKDVLHTEVSDRRVLEKNIRDGRESVEFLEATATYDSKRRDEEIDRLQKLSSKQLEQEREELKRKKDKIESELAREEEDRAGRVAAAKSKKEEQERERAAHGAMREREEERRILEEEELLRAVELMSPIKVVESEEERQRREEEEVLTAAELMSPIKAVVPKDCNESVSTVEATVPPEHVVSNFSRQSTGSPPRRATEVFEIVSDIQAALELGPMIDATIFQDLVTGAAEAVDEAMADALNMSTVKKGSPLSTRSAVPLFSPAGSVNGHRGAVAVIKEVYRPKKVESEAANPPEDASNVSRQSTGSLGTTAAEVETGPMIDATIIRDLVTGAVEAVDEALTEVLNLSPAKPSPGHAAGQQEGEEDSASKRHSAFLGQPREALFGLPPTLDELPKEVSELPAPGKDDVRVAVIEEVDASLLELLSEADRLDSVPENGEGAGGGMSGPVNYNHIDDESTVQDASLSGVSVAAAAAPPPAAAPGTPERGRRMSRNNGSPSTPKEQKSKRKSKTAAADPALDPLAALLKEADICTPKVNRVINTQSMDDDDDDASVASDVSSPSSVGSKGSKGGKKVGARRSIVMAPPPVGPTIAAAAEATPAPATPAPATPPGAAVSGNPNAVDSWGWVKNGPRSPGEDDV